MGGEHMEKTVSIDKQKSSLKGLLRKEAVAGAVRDRQVKCVN